MPSFQPVDYDPFAQPQGQVVPVDHDPFADSGGQSFTPAPEWGVKHPNLYGLAGVAWETVKPAIEVGAAGMGAAPGLAAVPVNPVLGWASALAGGGAGYAAAKQGTRQVDRWLGAPSDMSPAPLAKLAGVEKLPQTGQDIVSGAENIAELILGDKAVLAGARKLGEVSKYGKDLARDLYSKTLKASTTESIPARDAAIEAGLKEGIEINRKGLENLQGIVRGVNGKIDEILIPAQKSGETVSKSKILNGLNKLRAEARLSGDPEGERAIIDRVAEKFSLHPEQIPVRDAQKIKKNIYQELGDRAYKGNAAPKAEEDAWKQLAHEIKTGLEELHPELKSLNERQGPLLKLQAAIEQEVKREGNRNLKSPLSLKDWMNKPGIKTRVALALNAASEKSDKVLSALSKNLLQNVDSTLLKKAFSFIRGKMESGAPLSPLEEETIRVVQGELMPGVEMKSLQAGGVAKALPEGAINKILGPDGEFVINRGGRVVRKPGVPEDLSQFRTFDPRPDWQKEAIDTRKIASEQTSSLLDTAQRSQIPQTSILDEAQRATTGRVSRRDLTDEEKGKLLRAISDIKRKKKK